VQPCGPISMEHACSRTRIGNFPDRLLQASKLCVSLVVYRTHYMWILRPLSCVFKSTVISSQTTPFCVRSGLRPLVVTPQARRRVILYPEKNEGNSTTPTTELAPTTLRPLQTSQKRTRGSGDTDRNLQSSVKSITVCETFPPVDFNRSWRYSSHG